MRKNYLVYPLLLLLFPFLASAQDKVTISGYVKDLNSGETVIGATLEIPELNISATSNNYGFYSLSIPAGTYLLLCSYSGYDMFEEQVNADQDVKLDVEMATMNTNIDEVIITDTRKDAHIDNTQMGTNTLTTQQIEKLPVIFGETDVLKAIQLLPGVQSAGEANSGFYVRGGGPDQNLILLDDAVVYNSGHLFGFFSIFNSDAIKKVTLVKGGMNANYGGRLSSVLDVSMKDGNKKEYHGEGGIGLIASRLTFEGPIVKDKGSFIISGRRTYADLLAKPFLKGNAKNNGYFFYDANIKANYSLGPKDRLYASGYFGRDVFNYKGESGNFAARIPWGNATATLRWNHEWSGKLFMNTTAIFNDYQFAFEANQSNMDIRLNSAIRDLGAKVDFDYYPGNGHQVKFGAQYTYHRFVPNQFSGRSDSMEFRPDNALKKYGHESGLYVMDEFDLGEKIKINAGLRYSAFMQVGPYTEYISEGGAVTDSIQYKKGEPVQTYSGLEPRLNVRLKLTEHSSIKASVTRSMQYMHLVSNNASTLPTDLWVPSTKVVQPQRSWQYSLGYFQNFLDNSLETSVEVYYKDMRNQIEFRNGYTQGVGDPEKDFVFGKGYAYGAEFFVNKTKGKLTGWVGYTLSWTWREFQDLNSGKKFPAKYDRRHDLSITASYELNPKWTFSGVFIYGTGNAITLPTSFYFIDQTLIQHFSEINAFRIFPYHRLDIAATWTPGANKPKKRFQSSWNFSIYNVYSRLNPYFLYVDYEGSLAGGGTRLQVKKVSIFPIIPSITWNFKF